VATSEPRSVGQFVADNVRRMVTLQDAVTYFGQNGTVRAFLDVLSRAQAQTQLTVSGLVRRRSLLGATAATGLDEVLEEAGSPRLPADRARLLVCFQPWYTRVTAVTNAATSKIEVGDASEFDVGYSVRIRQTSALTEIRTVIAITTGTGPNGGDEVEVALLTNSYSPTTEVVDLFVRQTLPTDTGITTTVGVTFQLLEPVTVGDANPIMNGETTTVALLDKAWSECTVAGSRGKVEPYTVSGFTVAQPKVRGAFNPAGAVGGNDAEPDAQARYRAAYFPAILSVETQASILALAKSGDPNVLRTLIVEPTALRTVSLRVLTRQVGPLSSGAKLSLGAYMDQRMRAKTSVELLDVTLTAVSITATVSLDGTALLVDVWRAAMSRYVAQIDTATWEWGVDVERADLITILNTTAGVQDINTETFTPSSNVAVGAESLPYMFSLTLTDASTGDVYGDVVAPAY
jgi:hypothetical protein